MARISWLRTVEFYIFLDICIIYLWLHSNNVRARNCTSSQTYGVWCVWECFESLLLLCLFLFWVFWIFLPWSAIFLISISEFLACVVFKAPPTRLFSVTRIISESCVWTASSWCTVIADTEKINFSKIVLVSFNMNTICRTDCNSIASV